MASILQELSLVSIIPQTLFVVCGSCERTCGGQLVMQVELVLVASKYVVVIQS